jgi:transposase-like protein
MNPREEAVQRYRDGQGTHVIGAALGVDSKTVRSWLQAQGVTLRTPAEARKLRYYDELKCELRQAAVDLYLAGKSSKAVARILGVSSTNVLQWLKQAGVPSRSVQEAAKKRKKTRIVRRRPTARQVEIDGKLAREVPLTQGKVALVDEEDYKRVSRYNWSARTWPGKSLCYAQRFKRRKNGTKTAQSMHDFIMKPPRWFEVDHKNGMGLNNRSSNLRCATKAQNGANRGPNRNNTSGYKGVTRSRSKDLPPWKAQIQVNGVHYQLGYHETPQDAVRAYDEAARKHFGEFAWTNFQKQ